uniref:Anaphase-promoting complex subunit 2 n=1 Tax=Globisporangium ultimum (strain ATCC 200006 / CBS 805.95 / DAOM BR144) TaxID=431595 RepID=K3X5T3_GLOUD
MLRIDRDVLWRTLFAFDHDAGAEDRSIAEEDAEYALLATHSSGADQYYELIQHAIASHRQEPLRVMLVQRLGYWLRSDITPVFWQFFDGYDAALRTSAATRRKRHAFSLFCCEQLTLAMQFAEEAFTQCVQLASIFDDQMLSTRTSARGTMLAELKTKFRCLVFEDFYLKEKFEEVLVIFFSMSFQKFSGKEKFQAFDAQPIRELLVQLEWMGIAEPALLQVLHSQVRRMIHSTCGEDYMETYLDKIEEWACSELLPWLDDLLQTVLHSSTQKWREILSQHVLQEFGTLRISQLFEIIKDYPDRQVIPALDDLKKCLERTHQHNELVHEFRRALLSRLLQPGANTSEILDIYVSTIKAFHILDPKGVLLEALSEPVKEYLRKRKDTVRCIVSSLTDDQNGDLFEELRRNNMRLIQQDDDSDDDEDISSDDWEPDPIEADPTKTSRSRSSDDILRILVNIYGSRELFVNEYRMMLADKLLQNLEYNTDRDVQTLELLKLRFGEESLQQCEIMVRDIEDSKRINLNIQSTRTKKTAVTTSDAASKPLVHVDATIVSQHFWPPFQGDEFVLHPKVSSDIDEYKKSYEVLRNPRSLAWNPSLGSVQLSIELQGVERDFSVSPLQASIVLHFEDQDQWEVEALAAKLEISDDLLLKHTSVWINHGLLTFSPDRKVLIAVTSFQDARYDNDALMEEMETAVSSDAQEAEDLQMLETYIVGMLSNFGSLPIQRIHNMLSTFARSGAQPYDKTISGLSVILGKLVDKGKLELVAGQYQRAK